MKRAGLRDALVAIALALAVGVVTAVSAFAGERPASSLGGIPERGPARCFLLPTSTPTNTPTRTPTGTATNTPSPTNTPGLTSTPTNTPTGTPTDTPTNTPTGTPTDTPTDTPTNTPTNTPTDTPTNTPTNTPTDTPTRTPTNTPTNTPTRTPTNTPTATRTPTPKPTATPGPPTSTPTPKVPMAGSAAIGAAAAGARVGGLQGAGIAGRAANAAAEGEPEEVIFCDDFELRNFSRWSQVGTDEAMQITSSDVHQGTYAARANTTGKPAFAMVRFYATEYARVCYRIWFKHLSQGAGQTDQLMQFRNRFSSPIVTVFIAADGTLAYTNHVGGTTRTSAVGVSLGGYHELQVCVRLIGLPTRVETYFDGAPVAALTNRETLGSNRVRELVLGDVRPGLTHHDVFDDIGASAEVIG